MPLQQAPLALGGTLLARIQNHGNVAFAHKFSKSANAYVAYPTILTSNRRLRAPATPITAVERFPWPETMSRFWDCMQ